MSRCPRCLAWVGSERSGVMMADLSYRWGLEEVAGLLAGRWVPAVLTALAAGPLRYTDLLAEIRDAESRLDRTPLSDKSFAHTLKVLEGAQLIENYCEPATFAGASWYQLTRQGKTFLLALRPAIAWAIKYHADMAAGESPR